MRSYVVLGTNRFEAMVSFYRERLGLMEVDRWDQPDGRGVFLELPGLLVKIVDNDRERSPLILSASLDRLTEEFDGQYRIKSEPPLLVPIRELGRRDWKGSVDVDDLEAADLNSYGPLCAWTLARAHARSGDPIAIAAYLGSSDTFDHALTEFAERYADQNERDYEAFLEQIRQGRLQAAAES